MNMDSWSSATADHLHELMSSDDHHNNRQQSMVPMSSPVIKKEVVEYPEGLSNRPLCSPTMSTTMVPPPTAHLHPSDDFHCAQMDYGSNNGTTCTFGGAPGGGGGSSTSKVDPLIGFRPVEASAGGLLMRMDTSNNTTDAIVNCMGNRRKSGYDSSSSPDSPDRHFCSSTTASNGDLNLTRLEESGKEECDGPKRLCLVCGDSASGFHYGVASCEACKAFFKRTIQGNIEYTCPAANDCEINKRRRKACQACRFQKCLRMGMLKEGVRLDRVRGGRQKYRRNSELPYPAPNTPAKRPTLEENTIVISLMQCEPELAPVQVEGSTDRGSTSDPNRSIGLLSDIFDKEIISTIGWAKQVPGFTELTLNDQMRLLQCTWTEILTLSVAFRSIHSGGKLVFASDFSLDEKLAKESGVFDLYQPCMQVVDRLEKAGVCKEEYCLLKALVLSNADTRIEDHSAVKKFRESITSSLYDCISVMRQGNTTAHLNSVLLCLPSLRQSDQIIKRFWLAVRREGKVVMNKLFVEMLEAHFR